MFTRLPSGVKFLALDLLQQGVGLVHEVQSTDMTAIASLIAITGSVGLSLAISYVAIRLFLGVFDGVQPMASGR